jgi:SNF family Na+-dependent transporter
VTFIILTFEETLIPIFYIEGQGSMLNLIYHMGRHGGPAFLVILALVYITVGYPLYLLETMMGQYCGRKPLFMLRFMLPAFTGFINNSNKYHHRK